MKKHMLSPFSNIYVSVSSSTDLCPLILNLHSDFEKKKPKKQGYRRGSKNKCYKLYLLSMP